MSLTHGGVETFAIPKQRSVPESGPSPIRPQEQDEAIRAERIEAAIREDLHRALGLTADQAITGELRAHNAFHTDRAGNRLPKGEMVVQVTVEGLDTGHPPMRRLEIDDERRYGLSEETIAALGLRALGAPRTEVIDL